jgi:hypothetical protein
MSELEPERPPEPAKLSETAKPAEPAPRKKAGRPRIQFDLSVVEGLGRIGATAYEMSQVLPASLSTVEHRMADTKSDFSRAYRKGRALLNASLRRKQIDVAMAGNVTMLIWLGKQHLGQQDRSALDLDLDLTKCTNEQLDRLEAGEDPLVVMGICRQR